VICIGLFLLGFHFEDCGLQTFCRILYGGIKIWIAIGNGNDNLKRVLDLINSKASTLGKDPCPGILGTKSYIVSPDELEKNEIDFCIVSCNH